MFLNWIARRVLQRVAGLQDDFDERLGRLEELCVRLSEQTKRSRLRSLRPPQEDDELVARALAMAGNAPQPAEDLPTHAKLARTRRH